MAQHEVVWLGEDGHIGVAFDLLNNPDFARHYQPASIFDYRNTGPNDLDELRAIQSAFQDRSWWKRLWVVQEICHAQSILVLCGTKSLEWEKLCNVFSFLRQRGGPGVTVPDFSKHLKLLKTWKPGD